VYLARQITDRDFNKLTARGLEIQLEGMEADAKEIQNDMDGAWDNA
jgi:hypothetical protein